MKTSREMQLPRWFRRSVDETKAATGALAEPGSWLVELFGGRATASRKTITPSAAMSCTPARAAIEAISESLGVLPLLVYKRTPGGGKERAVDHPVYSLLHDAPNEWTSAADFKEQATRDCLLSGNSYSFINRVDGRVQELLRLDPTSVRVEIDGVSGEPIYRSNSGSCPRVFRRQDVLHLRAPSLDGVSGVAPIQACKEAIGLALVMEEHAARLFGNGARPSGLLMLAQKLGEEDVEKIASRWNAGHSGENAGKTAILHSGADFKQLALNSVDAQFLEIWQHVITEIARAFRVPPHLLFELGRATWGNAAEMGQAFVTFTLMRWVKQWEGEVRLKLFSPEERNEYTAEYLLDDMLRADISARATAYSTLIAARVLSPNEVRGMENRAPYEGGDSFVNPNTTSTTAPAPAAVEGESA